MLKNKKQQEKQNKKQKALPGFRMNFHSFLENCLKINTSKLSEKEKQKLKLFRQFRGKSARTLDDILFHSFHLCLGYSMQSGGFPSRRIFHWPFVPRKPGQGQSSGPGDTASCVPSLRDSQAAPAISQPPVIYAVTLLRAERSICLLFKKQHLFVFVLQAVYLKAQTRLKALFSQGKCFIFAQKNVLSACLHGF